jgi:hypothetical protein
MSQPSTAYVGKVVSWATSGVALAKVFPNKEQQFRARLCLECYRLFSENTSVPIRKLVKNIAARDYRLLLEQAALGNEEAAAMVAALGIVQDADTGAITARSETNISNDIWVVNQLLARLNVSKKYIHKAMFEDNISWMMNYGRKTGTWQAVKQANQDLAKINNDFKDDDDPQEQMPNTNINITGDVGVVKEGRESLSDEEREKLRRKYGLTDKELTVQMEEINGVWQPVEEEEKDIFVSEE